MRNIYNIYCDESRVENPESDRMIIGALFIPRKEKVKIQNKLKRVFQKHNFLYELKWNKTHKKCLDFYKEIVDYFFSESALNYRCIVVNKKEVKYEEYHDNDKELAFFKFYYLMLRKKIVNENDYYVFIDKKPTRDKNRARALHSYLESYILLHNKDCNIQHFQSYDSDSNLLIQLSDYLTGLMGFASNDVPIIKLHKNNSKLKMVNYCKEKLNRSKLCRTTALSEEKFNVFVWKGRYES